MWKSQRSSQLKIWKNREYLAKRDYPQLILVILLCKHMWGRRENQRTSSNGLQEQ